MNKLFQTITTAFLMLSGISVGARQLIEKQDDDTVKQVTYQEAWNYQIADFSASKKTFSFKVTSSNGTIGALPTENNGFLSVNSDWFTSVKNVLNVTKNGDIKERGIYQLIVDYAIQTNSETKKNQNIVQSFKHQTYKEVKQETNISLLNEIQIKNYNQAQKQMELVPWAWTGWVGAKLNERPLQVFDANFTKIKDLYKITKNDQYKKILFDVQFNWIQLFKLDPSNGHKPTLEINPNLAEFTYRLPDDDKDQPIVIARQTKFERLHTIRVTSYNYGGETFTVEFLSFEKQSGDEIKRLYVNSKTFDRFTLNWNIDNDGYYNQEFLDFEIDWYELTTLNQPEIFINATITSFDGRKPDKTDKWERKKTTFEKLYKVFLVQFGNNPLQIKINKENSWWKGMKGDILPDFNIIIDGSLNQEVQELYEYNGPKVYDNRILKNVTLEWVEYKVNNITRRVVTEFSYDGSVKKPDDEVFKSLIFHELKEIHATYIKRYLGIGIQETLWLEMKREDYDKIDKGNELHLDKVNLFLITGNILERIVKFYNLRTDDSAIGVQQDIKKPVTGIKMDWIESKKQVLKDGKTRYNYITLFNFPFNGPKQPKGEKPIQKGFNFVWIPVVVIISSVSYWLFYKKKGKQKK